jgi:WD40 repeat protein
MAFANTVVPRVQDEHITAQQFAFLPECRWLFTCGHWDHSCRITSVETGNLIQSMREHRDVITCLALAKDFGQKWLVTGSRDCTLMVWEVFTEREVPLKSQPQYVLYGHDDSISCVAINVELDIVISGSEDGTVIIHNLRDGTYVRTIGENSRTYAALSKALNSQITDGISDESSMSEFIDSNGRRMSLRPSSTGYSQGQVKKISWLGLSKDSYIVTYCADEQMLCTYSLNGMLITSRAVPEAIYCFLISEDGKVLITGGSSCLVVFRWVSIYESLSFSLSLPIYIGHVC